MRKIKLFLLLVFVVAGCSARAASTITAYITLTNLPIVGSAIVVNSTNINWTNNTGATAYWIQTTNSTPNATTNLYTKISGLTIYGVNSVNYTNATNLVVYGILSTPLVVTVSSPGGSNWAVVTYTTNVSASSYSLSLPHLTGNITIKHTNIHNDVVDLLNYANGSNKVSVTAPLWTNFPDTRRVINPPLTNQPIYGGTVFPTLLITTNGALLNTSSSNMMATNLTGTITNATVLNGTNRGTLITNSPMGNFTNLIGDSVYFIAGTVSNLNVIGTLTINGIMGSLTNGGLYHSVVTNSPWVSASNLVAKRSFTATNAVIDGLTVTNLAVPGSGASSFKIGLGALASGDYSIAIGDLAEATNENSVAFGYFATSWGLNSTAIGTETRASAEGSTAFGHSSYATATNSTALGYSADANHADSTAVGSSAQTTTTNQIRLGTATEHVSIPGQLRAMSGSISNIFGSNTLNGTLELKGGTVSTLVDGNNAGIILTTNSVVELSGGTTIAQIAGFAASRDGDTRLLRFTGAITNWIVNEANSVFSTDATAANRIVTGTGGDLTQTNQPAWLKVRYRSTSSRWEVLDYSR